MGDKVEMPGLSSGAQFSRISPVTMPAKELSPTPWPITGTLDLHLFRLKEVGDLLPEQVQVERRKRGILQVRIVHGKGRENQDLRRERRWPVP